MSSRVLYICGGRSFHSNKPGRKIAEVTACWQRAGHEVKLVGGADLLQPSRTIKQSQYGAQSTHDKWYRGHALLRPVVNTVSEWKDIQHDALMLKFIQAVCTSWRPDLIWERSSRLHSAGLILARMLGVPYVLEWKDHLVNYRLSLFRLRALRMERKKNRAADYIVVESNVLRKQLALELPRSDHVLVAHNAVRPEEFGSRGNRNELRHGLISSEGDVLVGYLGSYAFYHDAKRLVQAAGIVRKQSGVQSIRFLMLGAGKEYSACRNLATTSGLLNDSLFMMRPGVPETDVPALLRSLDVAVLPGSTDIICPIKVQEYMASELPSVVPDYECNREVIDDGRTGVLFRPGDAAALADRILNLANSADTRRRIGGQARQEIAFRFTWEKTWGAALQKALNSRGQHT